MSHKICCKCRRELDIEQFCKSKHKKDGRVSYCKECWSERRKSNYARRKACNVVGSKLPKVCTNCQNLKPSKEFYIAKESKDGLASWCKRCTLEKFHGGFTETQKNSDLKYHYGINLNDYERILASQNGVCIGCQTNTDKIRLCVDHDHITGQVRGLLCGKCNKALGLLGDDIQRIRRLADYLESHNSRMTQKENLT